MLNLGTQKISSLHLGGQEIKKAYLGDALVFDAVPAPVVYTITASIEPAGSGTVTGAGQYQEGESVTLKATVADGYEFTGWQENGQPVSADAEYTFTVTGDRTLTAVFEASSVKLGWKSSNAVGSGICYGNGVFLIGGRTRAYYSDDGATWKTSSWNSTGVSGTPSYSACAYGSGKFIALNGQYGQYSATAASWSKFTGMATPAKNGLSTDGTRFVCFPGGTAGYGYVYTSENGTTWDTLQSMPSSAVYRAAAYHNGRFVAIGYNTDEAAYFTWGGTPVQAKMPVSDGWQGVASGNGLLVAVAYGSKNAAYSEDDGATWRLSELPAALNWRAVAYGDGRFVAIAENSDKVACSRDGKSWVLADDALPGAWSWNGIVYGKDRFVAVASNGCAYSTIGS